MVLHKILKQSLLLFLIAGGSLWGQGIIDFQKKLEQISKGISLESVSLVRIHKKKDANRDAHFINRETFVDYSFEVMGKKYVFNVAVINRITDDFFSQNVLFNDFSIVARKKSVKNENDIQKLMEIKNSLSNLSLELGLKVRRENYLKLLSEKGEILEKDVIKTTLAEGCIVFDIGYWNHTLWVMNTKLSGKSPAEYVIVPVRTEARQIESIELARNYGALVSAGLIDTDPLMQARVYSSGLPVDVWTQLCPPPKAEQNVISVGMEMPTLDPENPSVKIGSEKNRLLAFPEQMSMMPANKTGYLNSQNSVRPKPVSFPEYSYSVSNSDWVMGGMHANGRAFVTSRWPLDVGLGVMVAVQYSNEVAPRMAYFDLSGGVIKISDGKLVPGLLVRSTSDDQQDWVSLKNTNSIYWNGSSVSGFEPFKFKPAITISTKSGTGSGDLLEALLTVNANKGVDEEEIVQISRTRWVQPRAIN